MKKALAEEIARYADTLAAIGNESRLRITAPAAVVDPDGMWPARSRTSLGSARRIFRMEAEARRRGVAREGQLSCASTRRYARVAYLLAFLYAT